MAEYHYNLRGDIDLANAPQLRADLSEAIAQDGAHLLVDCTHLTFIDSMGITVLLEANRKLESDGRHMLIVNVPERTQRVFEMLGLSDLLRYDRDGDADGHSDGKSA
jgi:anti-sigma B factor antagonist